MPLRNGTSQADIDANIAELIAAGHERSQAVAIAYAHARAYRHDADHGHIHAVAHLVANAKAHGTSKRRQRMPKQNYPRALEAQYAARLVAIVHTARAGYNRLLRRIPALLVKAQAERGDDARLDDVPITAEEARRMLAEAQAHMRRVLDSSTVEKLAQYFARETSQAQRLELGRQLKAVLGIDIPTDEKYVPALLDYFTHENATLIAGIPDELHQDVANLTARAFTKRMSPETYAAELTKQFDIAESRARFIARDQMGKLWGQLNATRQQGVGISEFTWHSMRDSHVRPSHARLEGKRFRYDNPPSVGLPGEDYGCRCVPDPVIDPLLQAAEQVRNRSRF